MKTTLPRYSYVAVGFAVGIIVGMITSEWNIILGLTLAIMLALLATSLMHRYDKNRLKKQEGAVVTDDTEASATH
jgi:hypothetical protein